MPTRYTLELEGLKNTVTAETFKEVTQREEAKKTVKKALEERYSSGKNRWFFTPLSELYWVGDICEDGWILTICRVLVVARKGTCSTHAWDVDRSLCLLAKD